MSEPMCRDCADSDGFCQYDRSKPCDPRLVEAVAYHEGKWPKQLWTGVMFFKGLRITRAQFKRATP